MFISINKLIIITIIIIFVFSFTNKEKMYVIDDTNDNTNNNINDNVNLNESTHDTIRQIIKEVYKVDVQAIKNLGDLAEQIKNGNGVLTIPSDVVINGDLTTDGNTELKGTVSIDNKLTVNDDIQSNTLLASNITSSGDIRGKTITVAEDTNGPYTFKTQGVDLITYYNNNPDNIRTKYRYHYEPQFVKGNFVEEDDREYHTLVTATSHNHDNRYSNLDHNHDNRYSKLGHTHKYMDKYDNDEDKDDHERTTTGPSK